TLSGVTDILIIPWVLSEMLFWIETWSSQELNSSKPIAKKFNLDPIVETALKSLTKSVNLSTGLAHPSDRTSTIQMFEILLENNISYNLDEVRAWLVSKGGWRPSDADKVVEIGQGVLDGKNFRTKGRMWRENIIDIWRLDAAKNTSNP
ncbi:MAG: hypothetical protein GW789_14985, partial [Ignavibacteria bacterium]|nr:hypothetical protein [Ignavibacteria bacterium]